MFQKVDGFQNTNTIQFFSNLIVMTVRLVTFILKYFNECTVHVSKLLAHTLESFEQFLQKE